MSILDYKKSYKYYKRQYKLLAGSQATPVDNNIKIVCWNCMINGSKIRDPRIRETHIKGVFNFLGSLINHRDISKKPDVIALQEFGWGTYRETFL